MRTQALRYQLNPIVDSIASLLFLAGLTSWEFPFSKTSSTVSRETRPTSSQAPGQVIGQWGLKGRSGLTCSLQVVARFAR